MTICPKKMVPVEGMASESPRAAGPLVAHVQVTPGDHSSGILLSLVKPIDILQTWSCRPAEALRAAFPPSLLDAGASCAALQLCNVLDSLGRWPCLTSLMTLSAWLSHGFTNRVCCRWSS